MFSQFKGYATGRIRFVYFRAEKRPHSESQRRQGFPSVAHLSSFIQSSKKRQAQKSLLQWNQEPIKQKQPNKHQLSSLPEPKETSLAQLLYNLEREANNQKLRKRKIQDDQILLSQIVDQAPCTASKKDSFKLRQQQELTQSRRRNYILRKLQFNDFLKAQEISRTSPLIQPREPKEVEYQNQKLKSQSVKIRIINNSCDNLKHKRINRHFNFSVLEGAQCRI